jgi:hypothetical protein
VSNKGFVAVAVAVVVVVVVVVVLKFEVCIHYNFSTWL